MEGFDVDLGIEGIKESDEPSRRRRSLVETVKILNIEKDFSICHLFVFSHFHSNSLLSYLHIKRELGRIHQGVGVIINQIARISRF